MAVKVIPIDCNPVVQSLVLSELEILHKCKSEHIIAYFGAFFSENRIKICTEYMDGTWGPCEVSRIPFTEVFRL